MGTLLIEQYQFIFYLKLLKFQYLDLPHLSLELYRITYTTQY